MQENYLVVKSNHFIMNSGYDLSSEEQKIILTLASMVNPEDEDFKPYILKISDFIELMGTKDQSKYTELPKITKELMKKVFEIEEGDTLVQTAWLSSVKYEKGTGLVELSFSHHLKPYMLQLNQLYTQYKLTNILNMKSKYSIRIYEILKSNEFKKQKSTIIEVDTLRKLLKSEELYLKYNDFKRCIIVRSQKELKKYSDISFEFAELKTGKKVTAIQFFITKNTPNGKHIDIISSSDDKIMLEDTNLIDTNLAIIRNLIDEPITESEIRKLNDAASGDLEKLSSVYRYYKKVSMKKKINNTMGYLLTLLKNGYDEPVGNIQEKAKKDFEEREYDYDDLEKKLLGWK